MLCKKRNAFFQYLQENFPESFGEIKEKNLIGPHFLSPFTVKLPKSLLTQVKKLVTTLYEIKESEDYQSKLPEKPDWRVWPKTPCLLTCFDFHYSEQTGLKLIEINTNASLFISTQIFMEAQGEASPDPGMKSLLKSFEKSFSLQPGDPIHILDRQPKDEGLYFEFLLFQQWLRSHNYKANILALEDYPLQKPKNIYNRFTDFYFSEPGSKLLNEDYIKEKVRFSPNPREYFLLSDKKRYKLLRDQLKNHKDLINIIPVSKSFSEFENKETLWTERKKYFFKPSESFGGKGAFKGKSISRRTFDKIYAPDFIAQQLCPAGQKTFDYEGQPVTMKFDLRFYSFEGKIQSYVARLYRGQTTNMKTEMGGLAPLFFV